MVKTALTLAVTTTLKGINAVKIELTVNGLNVQAQYHDEEIERVHKPLLQYAGGLTDGKSRAATYGGFSLRSAGDG